MITDTAVIVAGRVLRGLIATAGTSGTAYPFPGRQPLGLPPQHGGMHNGGIFAGLGVFACFGVASLLFFVFWLWMLIDCLTRQFHEPNDKLVWVLVIIFLPLLGALLYFFIGRPRGTRAGQ